MEAIWKGFMIPELAMPHLMQINFSWVSPARTKLQIQVDSEPKMLDCTRYADDENNKTFLQCQPFFSANA